MRTPERLSGDMGFQGKSLFSSEKRGKPPSFLKSGLENFYLCLRDAPYWFVYAHLFLPITSGFIIGSSKSLGWPAERTRAEFMTKFFGEGGRKWLERTGKDKYLSKTTGREVYKEDAAVYKSIGILATPVSQELALKEQNFNRLLQDRIDVPLLTSGEITNSGLTLSSSAQEELATRIQSVGDILKEFIDPLRRERKKSDTLRQGILSRLRKVHNRYGHSSRLPTLEAERSLAVYLLTLTEFSPPVLRKEAQTIGDFIEIWIDRLLEQKRQAKEKANVNLAQAVRTEFLTGGRIDVPPVAKRELDPFSDNFSSTQITSISKSLVAICFRQVPEAQSAALKKARFLAKKMKRSDQELKTEGFGVSTSGTEEWNKIKKILNLPVVLPREIGQPLQKYLDVDYDVEPQVDLQKGEVFIVLEQGVSVKNLEKTFTWAALHFPQSKKIIVKFETNPGNVEPFQKGKIAIIQEEVRDTKQVYDENLLGLREEPPHDRDDFYQWLKAA